MGFIEKIKEMQALGELELAFLLAGDEKVLRIAREWDHLGQVIANEQLDKWEMLRRLERNDHDTIVRSTEIAEEVSGLRSSMLYASELLVNRVGVYSELVESNNGSVDDPQSISPTVWHFSLESSWFA
jgi:hypothetical protein